MAESFAELIIPGVDIVRLNASHFNQADLEEVLHKLSKLPVKVMLDLPGPEYRIYGYAPEHELQDGQTLEIGNNTRAYHTDFYDWHLLRPQMRVLIQDGQIEAGIISLKPDGAELCVTRGGKPRASAHLSFPDLPSEANSLTDKDKSLIRFALEHQIAQIALSHINHPAYIIQAREFISALAKDHKPALVVKIETKTALANLDEIISQSDILLLGRGDLGSQVPLWEIPLAQRRLIRQAQRHGKAVYIATQMLPSLFYDRVPSRSDVSDIAFAVLDGAAGITLTDETVRHDDPRLAISWGRAIIEGVLQMHTAWDASAPLPDQELISKLSDIGTRIWARGWAEANAGNVSIRLTDYGDDPLAPITYLVSRTGSRYRQIADDPMQSLCLIEAQAEQWHSLSPEAKPTSEWSAHLKLHQLFRAQGNDIRVVLHAHPASVIAISHLPIFQDETLFNLELAEILPELPLYLAKGVCCCPTYPPGSIELAEASASCLGERNAMIWQKHGLLCFGKTLDEAFDYMEIVVKAAELWLTCHHRKD